MHPRVRRLTSPFTMDVALHACAASMCVSLASVVCVGLLPWLGARETPFTADDLAAFAAGVMLTDATTHQLPHSYENGSNASMACVLGILAFYVVDLLVSAAGGGRHQHVHEPSRRTSPRKIGETEKREEHEDGSLQEAKKPLVRKKAGQINSNRRHIHGTREKTTGMMNLVADGIHNYTDGLAIGATFITSGIPPGWNTAIAMLAHEVPQEIGDFGILICSGFSPIKALFYNFLTSLTVVLGTVTSLVLGTKAASGDHWMATMEAATAGGFIYLSVGHILPELKASLEPKRMFRHVLYLALGLGVCLSVHAFGTCCDHDHGMSSDPLQAG